MSALIGFFADLLHGYGLAGFIVIVILAVVVASGYLIIYLVKRNVERTAKREDNSNLKEDKYIDIIKDFTKSMADNTAALKEMGKNNDEAHRYQREEHIKSIEILNTVTMGQAVQTQVLSTLEIATKGLELAVGRINGYIEGKK